MNFQDAQAVTLGLGLRLSCNLLSERCLLIDSIHISGIRLELACNWG